MLLSCCEFIIIIIIIIIYIIIIIIIATHHDRCKGTRHIQTDKFIEVELVILRTQSLIIHILRNSKCGLHFHSSSARKNTTPTREITRNILR